MYISAFPAKDKYVQQLRFFFFATLILFLQKREKSDIFMPVTVLNVPQGGFLSRKRVQDEAITEI